MPRRLEKFVNGSFYHVFNKTVDDLEVFDNDRNSRHFIQLLKYYRSLKANVSFSKLKRYDSSLRKEIFKKTSFKKHFKIEILAYCLMPNHFHLLLKQLKTDGIVRFMAVLLDSFARYFNIASERKGPLFLTQFKSKQVKSGEQLIHVSRYIHLNPYSSSLTEKLNGLENYRFFSLPAYLSRRKDSLCKTQLIMSYFGNSRKKYQEFVYNYAERQKTLEHLKHTKKWL